MPPDAAPAPDPELNAAANLNESNPTRGGRYLREAGGQLVRLDEDGQPISTDVPAEPPEVAAPDLAAPGPDAASPSPDQ